MKFAIASDSRLKTHGASPEGFRKSKSGKKIIQLSKLEKTSGNAKSDKNIIIYDHMDPEFRELMKSEEWRR